LWSLIYSMTFTDMGNASVGNHNGFFRNRSLHDQGAFFLFSRKLRITMLAAKACLWG
jgi:hypothetical protein